MLIALGIVKSYRIETIRSQTYNYYCLKVQRLNGDGLVCTGLRYSLVPLEIVLMSSIIRSNELCRK